MTVGLNPYAHMLLDPEHAQVMGIPDEYPYKTHKCKIAMSRTANFDANGNAFCTIGKSIAEFFGQLESSSKSAWRQWDFSNYASSSWQPQREWHREEDYPNAGNVAEQFPPHFLDVQNDHIETSKVGYNDSSALSSTDMVRCSAGDEFVVSAYTADTTANAWKVNCRFVTNGVATTVESALLTGGGVLASATITAPAGTTGIYEWGFERVAGTGTITGTRCSFTISSAKSIAYEPIGKEDGSEFATLKSIGTRARIVAMSLWAQYSGSLTSNGKITAGQISHQDLSRLPDTDIGTLSVLPGFYSDSLLKPDEAGAYAWFRPLSAEDLKFEDLDRPDEVGSRLMCAIHANDANAQNVTFRCVAVVEIQTTNQVVSPTTNIVNPPMIWEAQRELKNFPSGMGNTNHLKIIANKLKSIATNAAHKIGTLGPAVMGAINFLKDQGAAVPLEIEMGVQKAMQYAPAVAGFAESIL